MTSESPKEIFWNGMDYASTMPFAGGLSYTLTAHAQAMVAAAYEDAADVCVNLRSGSSVGYNEGWNDGLDVAEQNIRARTTDDQRTALDALLKAERVKGRVEGLKEAAKWSCSIPTGVPDHYAQAVVDMNEHWKDAILALIERETGHE